MEILNWYLINIILKLLQHKSLYLIAYLSISIITCVNCGGPKKAENAISEGVIDYKTEVINTSHPLASFAPSTATAKIKENKWILEMSAMGFFNVYFSCDINKGTLTEMIKYLDIKNACVENDSMLKEENNNYLLTFKETKETKMIAGFKCKKVIATKVSAPATTFEVYYTPDIGVENSNALTPYKELKGMLMDYRIVRLGIEMHFIATGAKKDEIKDSDFEIPSNFKIFTRKEFDAEFDRLFADFY